VTKKTLYVANGLATTSRSSIRQAAKAVISIPVGRVPWGIVVDD